MLPLKLSYLVMLIDAAILKCKNNPLCFSATLVNRLVLTFCYSYNPFTIAKISSFSLYGSKS